MNKIWAYHCTTYDNLSSISKEGLCIKASHCWPDRVWFIDTEHGYPPMKHCNGVLLRFPWPTDTILFIEKDELDPAEYYVKHDILPFKLEMLTKKGWQSLKNIDNLKPKQYSLKEVEEQRVKQ